MTEPTSAVSIPAAWLRPVAEGYRIPLWRWFLLPATTIMFKRYGGVWVNGALHLTDSDLRFAEVRAMKFSKKPLASWAIPFADISHVTITKGFASETLEIHMASTTAKLMTARADAFIEKLRAVVPVR